MKYGLSSVILWVLVHMCVCGCALSIQSLWCERLCASLLILWSGVSQCSISRIRVFNVRNFQEPGPWRPQPGHCQQRAAPDSASTGEQRTTAPESHATFTLRPPSTAETRQATEKLYQQSHEGLEESQGCQLWELLEQSTNIFNARDEDCTRTSLVHTRLTPEWANWAAAEQKIQIMVGVMEPSRSPYAAFAILVKKKNGSWCFCVDYCHLNKVINSLFTVTPHLLVNEKTTFNNSL